MSTPGDPVEVLNPETHLYHLLPKEAAGYETARNALLILFGTTVMDIIQAICCSLCSQRRDSEECALQSNSITKQLTIENLLAMPINNLHTRVRAGFADSPRVQRFFSIFWLINALSYVTIVLGARPIYIPGTRHFKNSGIAPVVFLTMPISIVHDSSIFLAISYKIAFAHTVVDSKVGWRTFILGKALPRLSHTVLRVGQRFYLSYPVLMVPAAVLICLPSISQISKSLIMIYVTPLLASRTYGAFRKIELFEYDVSLPYPISEIQFL